MRCETLYKRNAKGIPIEWTIKEFPNNILEVSYGPILGTKVVDTIPITAVKANEFDSRVKAKRKDGYKKITELKDSATSPVEKNDVFNFVNNYLPKNNTSTDGFVLPMLAKTLEDNKPFEKVSYMLGQWKIDGLRCLIGAEKVIGDLFKKYRFTYHSREGEDWTPKMQWMDDILAVNLKDELIDVLIDGAYLDGELYLPGHTVNDINSYVKNTNCAEHYTLQYWCYDIAMEGVCAFGRSDRLINWCNTKPGEIDKNAHLNCTKPFVLLPSYSITDIQEARLYRDKFISYGFEGLICRDPMKEYQFDKRNSAMYKYKRVDDGLFTIVNIVADKRGLPVYTLKNDINEELFDCTINLPHARQKVQLEVKDQLIGKRALVEFRARSGVKQVPFHAKIITIYV